MWLDEWTRLPLWFKLSTAFAVSGYSLWALAKGVIWPWGLVIGFMLLVMSFLPPIGPPRRKKVSGDR